MDRRTTLSPVLLVLACLVAIFLVLSVDVVDAAPRSRTAPPPPPPPPEEEPEIEAEDELEVEDFEEMDNVGEEIDPNELLEMDPDYDDMAEYDDRPETVPAIPGHSWSTPITTYDAAGNRQIKFWNYGGPTQIKQNFVRIGHDRPTKVAKQGWMWNTMPVKVDDWTAVLKFRASGVNKRVFGEGIALWYTKVRQPGPVLGGSDKWTGLGVFFDTHRNIEMKHSHMHPYISAMVNNGKKEYAKNNQQFKNGCHLNFRLHEDRSDFRVTNHTTAYISYKKETLKVTVIHGDKTVNCFSMPGVKLPKGYFFGITSQTGERHDNHDIIGFSVHDMTHTDEDLVDLHDAVAAWEEETSFEDMDDEEIEEVNRIVAKSEAILEIEDELDHLEHVIEHTISAVTGDIEHAIKNAQVMDDKNAERMQALEEQLEKIVDVKLAEMESRIPTIEARIQDGIDEAVATSGGSGWKKVVVFLFILVGGLAFAGYRKYQWMMKRHIL